jgi:hypothetical protein
MELLIDSGHSLPDNLADLDTITPYGTLFRYEDLPEEIRIDRQALVQLVKSLRAYVESQPPATEEE